jgi:hypothetical protein
VNWHEARHGQETILPIFCKCQADHFPQKCSVFHNPMSSDSDSELDYASDDDLIFIDLPRSRREFCDSDSNCEEESAGDDEERLEPPSQVLTESQELERAIAASLVEQQNPNAESTEDDFQRLLRESEREERERREIREFISDSQRFRDLLREMPGVDPSDPCFQEFCP